MKTNELIFLIFVDGFCLFALYMLSLVVETMSTIFYFGCGLVFTVTFIITVLVIGELQSKIKEDEDVENDTG